MFRFLGIVLMVAMPMSAMAKSILVLGDSISAAYGIQVDQGWVALLQDKLKMSKNHSDAIIHNESISGDTSGGGLARIDRALALHKPSIVLLELGANDGLRGLSPVTMKSNLIEITRRVQKTGAKVLLLGMKIPPNYGKRYIDLFYNVYPQLAEELKIPFVPFILEEVALDPALMQADGLHPNAKAQPLIADKIAPYLFPLL
ncbi:MAG: arylesterase [Methylovulum sp.]|uniref:arylesterase n=1 Tax=Methylovulum sp. TaxID=1916980 RepID=UPI0026332149|nr:arylesterase [Methylovulum sp.]MDD2723125.1 arylesterase [Methylovulum sp.]MDD5124822.1 arylesterase [Methylovulum sp.]